VRVPVPARIEQGLSWACGDPDELLAALRLSAGAARVFRELHRLAGATARARGYAARPASVTLHLPQGLLALAVGYTPRHLRRLLPELVTAGLLDWGAHASKVGGMSLWDGCLWAVKLQPGDHLPHLNREEWRHGWRDFAGDIEAGRTVKALLEGMSALHPEEVGKVVQDALKAWAVNPGNINSPVACIADMPGDSVGSVQDVREVVYRLGTLPTVHPSKRSAAVGRLASALSKVLDDQHSRRWYCAVIWEAWRAEVEGRAGLQVLAAQLARLDADRREWQGLRRPAALLAARLRAAA